MYYSIWWFLAGLGSIMIFTAYRFYAVRLEAMHDRNEVLAQQVDQLHVQLDNAMHKAMSTNKEIEQMKKVKQQMLSVISHEIRTPMNGIMGMSVLLKETPLSKEQQEYTETIRSCGESLLTTVNDMLVSDILNLSKRNTEEQKSENKDFDLRDCVEEVLEMFAAKTSVTGVDLMYDIDESVPLQIIGDSKRLQQVLINLVENAVKFTSHGEICVNVNSLIHGTNKPELIFEVKDTGAGIGKDQLQQFFKGNPGKDINKESDGESTGLGLIICKKLVYLMDGYIEVKSEVENGSNFAFSIPLTPSLKPVRSHARDINMSKLERKRILIADDNPTQRSIFMKQMQAWKAVPFLADTGKQALGILSQETVELAIIDLRLSDMSAIELAKSIKNQYPAIPIILMNAYGNESYKQEPELFSFIISKPLRQNVLLDNMLDVFTRTTIEKPTAIKKLTEDFSQQYPLRILIAEDNIVNQKLATRMLNKLGYQPDLAGNGKVAIEMVGHEHYDIILMDVQMPEMDGLEATRMIRTCLEVQPVIIAVTANVMLGDRDDCMQAGMDDYISKPIELNELIAQLEKWYLAIKNKRKISA